MLRGVLNSIHVICERFSQVCFFAMICVIDMCYCFHNH